MYRKCQQIKEDTGLVPVPQQNKQQGACTYTVGLSNPLVWLPHTAAKDKASGTPRYCCARRHTVPQLHRLHFQRVISVFNCLQLYRLTDVTGYN